jgi:hypothetical protein
MQAVTNKAKKAKKTSRLYGLKKGMREKRLPILLLDLSVRACFMAL